jgi:hypothetical protein
VLTFFLADNNRLTLEQPDPTQGFVVPHQQIIETIGASPAATEGSHIGLSVKASKVMTRTEGATIFAGLVEEQPIMTARVDVDGEELFETALLSNLIGQIPASINDAELMNPSLTETLADVKGTIDIDDTLENVVRLVVGNRASEAWHSLAFPFVLTLRAFICDLRIRIEFMDVWIKQGPSVCFIISHSFIRGNFLLLPFRVMQGRMLHLSIGSVDHNAKTSD